MKKLYVLPVLFVTTALLFGCALFRADSKDPDTHLTVQKDGSLTQVIHERFDEGNYSIDELKAEIEQELSDYNAGAPSPKAEIVLKRASLTEEGLTDVELTYPSAASYAEFNGETLYIGDAGRILNAEFSLDAKNMLRAEDQTPMTAEELQALTGERLLVSDTIDRVYLPGKILYASENAQLSESKTSAIRIGDSAELMFIIYQ